MEPSKEVKEKIEQRYNTYKTSSPDKFIRENEDVKKYLEALVQEDSWFHNVHDAFYMVAKGIYVRPKCKVCGINDLTIEKIRNNIYTCSRVCGGKNPERLEKVKKTTMERYGVENAFQSKEFQEKQKKTCMEKYGVENVFQNENIKEKIKQTNLDKYGVEYVMQNQGIKEKSKKSCLEKYGVEYAVQNDDVKNKIVQTNLQKFGTKTPAQNPQVIEKMKQTCINKYGVDCTFKYQKINEKRQNTWKEKYGGNPLCDEQVIEKRFQTNIEKYGNKSYVKSIFYMSKEYDKIVKRFEGKVIPMFTKEEYHGINCKEVYKWKCAKCGNEFKSRIYMTLFDPEDNLTPRCYICYPKMKGESKKELEVLDFIKSIYQGEVIHGDRTVIKPSNEEERNKELDIYIPEKKIAIEFNGIYWHSESQGKSENYHLNKTESCEKQGIQLIHIFEDEWNDKQDIVKDRIKSILGIYDKKIYARKCEVKEINTAIKNEFLENNHLQGKDSSSIKLGLYYNDELIAVMTFGKPRFSNDFDYEMLRFSSKVGYHVVGGASKLLSAFKKHYKGSIISYADRRYSNGKLYKAIGFKFIRQSEPNYFYINGEIKLSRYQCQKHKLKKLLGEENFDENLSEMENMLFNGFEKVYDCGNLVFGIN